MSHSKITKKGQITIPIRYRRRYNLKEGAVVAFEESAEGLIVKPVPDIADSAGSLSKYANSKELVLEVIRAREENFR